MKLNLAQINFEKFSWISHMSLSFALHDGYLVYDFGTEIQIMLHNIYESEANVYIRNHDYDDAFVLYSAISNDTDSFLVELLETKAVANMISVINIDAGIGIKAIWLAKYLKNINITVVETNKFNFEQLMKNLSLNKDIANCITPHQVLDLEMLTLKVSDLLICPVARINQFRQEDNLWSVLSNTSIVVVNEFPSASDRDSYANYIEKYGFMYKHFDQCTISWKI